MLVVSGSPVNSVVVSRIVRDCGVKPVTASSHEAIDIMQSSRPLLVIVEANGDQADIVSLLDYMSGMADAPPAMCLIGTADAEQPDYPFAAVTKMPVSTETIQSHIDRCL